LPKIDEALGEQRSSIHRLLEGLSTRIIEEDQLIANGFAPDMFLNVNTLEDLEQARTIAKTIDG
jgi:molybdopterin-guanine dinucleotide biosynthesis protein A